MKRFIMLGFCFILVGCESVPVAPVILEEAMQRRFITVSQLRIGLSRGEVAGLLGKEVVTGYALTDDSSGQYKPITVVNPQRSEIIKKNNRIYTIDYYLVGIKVADDKISDDELVPLTFYKERLVGIGWDFLNKHVKGQ